ncbi:OmpP1/FadL family transporter [Marinomonas posidonica]|uniref:Membrane protein involved in aromatic hydrocarbon degradation n=1 Tax=Marinomonas posidonica (strain CECT 7376 / NCIMB 14433 / IVIA-Po-181) TaxID=491952 RepID=F6CXY0_MARPP|nr:outer membrane protein transport protein [Marinomonas posidonica]AEF54542.1 membrane protein involved in aromatic hydrocarbon degradation [Marinomonas posidonica IVIA-Po-181]
MTTSSKGLFKVSVVAVSVAAASSAFSAGFALNDHSATASGAALAGAAASTSDISFSFWNPALFTNADTTTFMASGAYIMPSMDVTLNSAEDAASAASSGALANQDISSDGVTQDSVDDTLVPSLYFAKPISDKTVAGISLNVPFGLSGDYGQDWAGRFHATETGIQDIALSFALAHRVSEKLSVGASVQLHQAEVVLESAVGTSTALAGGEGIGRIEADATGYGFSLGVLFEPVKGTRLGAGYRSEVDFDFEGDVKYTDVSSTLTAAGLVDADVTDSITFPSVLTLSVEHDLNDKVTLGLSAIRTGWGAMDGINIDFDSTQSNSVLTFGFEDQWMYSAGVNYVYSDKLTLRTGVAMDNSPVTDEYRSARTPDGDRKWISVGATYDFNDMTSASFAFTHVMIEDVTVNRDGSLTEDGARGTLNADYESSANVFSASVSMAF